MGSPIIRKFPHCNQVGPSAASGMGDLPIGDLRARGPRGKAPAATTQLCPSQIACANLSGLGSMDQGWEGVIGSSLDGYPCHPLPHLSHPRSVCPTPFYTLFNFLHLTPFLQAFPAVSPSSRPIAMTTLQSSARLAHTVPVWGLLLTLYNISFPFCYNDSSGNALCPT